MDWSEIESLGVDFSDDKGRMYFLVCLYQDVQGVEEHTWSSLKAALLFHTLFLNLKVWPIA